MEFPSENRAMFDNRRVFPTEQCSQQPGYILLFSGINKSAQNSDKSSLLVGEGRIEAENRSRNYQRGFQTPEEGSCLLLGASVSC